MNSLFRDALPCVSTIWKELIDSKSGKDTWLHDNMVQMDICVPIRTL